MLQLYINFLDCKDLKTSEASCSKKLVALKLYHLSSIVQPYIGVFSLKEWLVYDQYAVFDIEARSQSVNNI